MAPKKSKIDHHWTKGGKPVKDTGEGPTVAETNKKTAAKIDDHVKWWKLTPLQRALILQDQEETDDEQE